MPSNTAGLTVTRDETDPARFHVAGRRVSGTVSATISINRRNVDIHRPDPEVIVNAYFRASDNDALTINGIAYNGSAAVQHYPASDTMRHPWWPERCSANRAGDVFSNATDNARDVMYDIAAIVAEQYATPEVIAARFVAEADSNIEWARRTVAEARKALSDAIGARAALTGATPDRYRTYEVDRITTPECESYSIQIWNRSDSKGRPSPDHTKHLRITPAELVDIRALFADDTEDAS